MAKKKSDKPVKATKAKSKPVRKGGTKGGVRKENPRQNAFLAAFGQTGIVTTSLEAAGNIPMSTYTKWRVTDPVFAKRLVEARKKAGDYLEAEALERAKKGVARIKFWKGKPLVDPFTGQPYIEYEKSDRLCEFLLKGAKPKKYRERTENLNTNLNKGSTDVTFNGQDKDGVLDQLFGKLFPKPADGEAGASTAPADGAETDSEK